MRSSSLALIQSQCTNTMNGSLKYDEKEVLAYIRKALPEDKEDLYTDSQIMEIIDIIYEWYDRKGYLNLDLSTIDEEEADISELTEYVKSRLKSADLLMMDTNDIDIIVKAEVDYEESIAEFE